MAEKTALGIAVESPQPDAGSARTWNEKPDPCGNAQIIINEKKYLLIIFTLRIVFASGDDLCTGGF